jgi:subtilisin family serine protease
MARLDRLQRQIATYEGTWNALNDKVNRLEASLTLEPRVDERMRLTEEIKQAKARLNEIDQELQQLEDELNKAKDKGPEPGPTISGSQPRTSPRLETCAWGVQRINAPAVWGAYGVRGEGVTIGVLDTGIDASHPDLQGKVVNWAEFNSVGQRVEQSEPSDSGGHGTFNAGILVGGAASGSWIGVAPDARLAVAAVLKDGSGTTASILGGMQWLAEQKVDVILASLGSTVSGESTDIYTMAILNLEQLGIPVVTPIGNDGALTLSSPADDLFSVSVGAIDHRDRVAGFSGGGSIKVQKSRFIDKSSLPLIYLKPDLTAPGIDVYSCVPGKEWQTWSGTSMAAAHVAGAIALLLSATRLQEVEVKDRPFRIRDLLCESSDELGEAGQDIRYGHGCVNALRAVFLGRQRIGRPGDEATGQVQKRRKRPKDRS